MIKSCLKKTKSDANDRDLAASALDTVGRIHTTPLHPKLQIAKRKDVWQVARVTYQEDLLLVHTFLVRESSRFSHLPNPESILERPAIVPSTPPVSSGVAIPVPDSDDELLDSVPSDGLNHKTTYYGEAFKTFKKHENATANTYKVASCQEPRPPYLELLWPHRSCLQLLLNQVPKRFNRRHHSGLIAESINAPACGGLAKLQCFHIFSVA